MFQHSNWVTELRIRSLNGSKYALWIYPSASDLSVKGIMFWYLNIWSILRYIDIYDDRNLRRFRASFLWACIWSRHDTALKKNQSIVHPRAHQIYLNLPATLYFLINTASSLVSGSSNDHGTNIACIIIRDVLDYCYIKQSSSVDNVMRFSINSSTEASLNWMSTTSLLDYPSGTFSQGVVPVIDLPY